MKYKYLIGAPAKHFATEWDEIQRLYPNELRPEEDLYIIFKALEFNRDFDKEILTSRKRLGLPEKGYSWEDYKRINHTPKTISDEEREQFIKFIRSYPKEITRICTKMALHPRIEEQLRNIFLGDYIEPYQRTFAYGTNADELDEKGHVYQDGDVEFIQIFINKKMSKNELLKSIENEWKDIEKLIALLPEEPNLYISKRDMRIIELRDIDHMKYKDIAENIIKEFHLDNLTASINEDSVKTSYKRARSKIDSLAKSRK